MTKILSLAIVLIALMWCVPAFPLAAGHPPGHPVGQNPEWPAGLADLLNSPGRVHGFFINANDFYFYREDTDEFNLFLEQYARLERTPLTLVLQPGPGKTDFITPDDKEITFDWKVNVYCRGWAREAPPDPTGTAGRYVIVLEVHPGGEVELNKIKVPVNVKLRSGGEDERFARFVAAHEQKHKQAKTAEDKEKTLQADAVKDASVRFINLDPYVTAGLEAHYYGGSAGSDLPLEPGKQRIGGLDFRIGKGLIQLGGSNLEKMPREVKGIQVGLRFRRLRVLHSCSRDASEGTQIGGYTMHYDDETTVEIPIEYGVHVKDWWAHWGQMAEVSGAQAVWTSGTALSPPVRLYVMTWDNPSPDKVVATMDCSSTGADCAPFVVAMTVEEGEAFPGPSTVEVLRTLKLRSENPRYTRLHFNQDGSKALSILFDESKGTGKGYNLLYADANFNKNFEEAEKLEAKTLERDGNVIAGSFPPIKIEVPYDDKSNNVARWQIAFGYHAPRAEPQEQRSGWTSREAQVSVGDFHVTANLRLGRGSDEWRYFMSGDIEAAESLDTARTWSAHDDPKLKVTTRPDGRNKGNLGIGLELDTGESELACHKGGSPAKAHVEIKNPDGAVVHEGDETLDKFVFG